MNELVKIASKEVAVVVSKVVAKFTGEELLRAYELTLLSYITLKVIDKADKVSTIKLDKNGLTMEFAN